jgi:hypothetical protein
VSGEAHQTAEKQAQNACDPASKIPAESGAKPPSQALDILAGTLWDVSAASLRARTVAALTNALTKVNGDEAILAVVAELRAWRRGR